MKRIRALVAIALFGVAPGDLGGYIEAECNAQVSGNAWVSGDAQVSGDAWVYGDASSTPIQVGGLRWKVTITDAHMTIGCQSHSLTDWLAFEDASILRMSGKDALRFWRDHKDTLMTLARATGRMT